MAHEIIDEFRDALAEILGFIGELRQRFREAMCNLNVAASQLAHELYIVISRHTQRCTAADSVHHEFQHLWDFRTAIHEVTHEDELASLWMAEVRSRAFRRRGVLRIQRVRVAWGLAG